MSVQELIDKLQQIEDKSLPIWGTGGMWETEHCPLLDVEVRERDGAYYPKRVVISE